MWGILRKQDSQRRERESWEKDLNDHSLDFTSHKIRLYGQAKKEEPGLADLKKSNSEIHAVPAKSLNALDGIDISHDLNSIKPDVSYLKHISKASILST